MLPEEDSARGFSCMMIIGIVFWLAVIASCVVGRFL
jgi:hypothetical protein